MSHLTLPPGCFPRPGRHGRGDQLQHRHRAMPLMANLFRPLVHPEVRAEERTTIALQHDLYCTAASVFVRRNNSGHAAEKAIGFLLA
jgi:hypothetical protein